MDIKKYIKEELSLDQKAKLYFMGLVRQGKIDRLPEDPKAAYVSIMMDKMEEGDTYEKMAAKGKKAGNLKQGTVRKRLRIKDGEKIPLARINKAISGLKKRKSLSDKDKKYLKALNLAKTLKTTTNVKEIATELGYINESVDITYTDPGDRFYKMKVNGKRLDREEGTKYLKGLGINMEIPGMYEINKLNKIVKALKEKGIDADYNAGFDPS
jgi:hypothetical protein